MADARYATTRPHVGDACCSRPDYKDPGECNRCRAWFSASSPCHTARACTTSAACLPSSGRNSLWCEALEEEEPAEVVDSDSSDEDELRRLAQQQQVVLRRKVRLEKELSPVFQINVALDVKFHIGIELDVTNLRPNMTLLVGVCN